MNVSVNDRYRSVNGGKLPKVNPFQSLPTYCLNFSNILFLQNVSPWRTFFLNPADDDWRIRGSKNHRLPTIFLCQSMKVGFGKNIFNYYIGFSCKLFSFWAMLVSVFIFKILSGKGTEKEILDKKETFSKRAGKV